MGRKILHRCRRKIKKATSKYSPCEERPLKWTARVCKMKIPQLWYSHISKIWCLASIQLDFTAENIPASQSADYELYNWNRLKPRHQSVQSLWNLYCHQKTNKNSNFRWRLNAKEATSWFTVIHHQNSYDIHNAQTRSLQSHNTALP